MSVAPSSRPKERSPDLRGVRDVGALVRWAADVYGSREAWTFLDGDEPDRWSFVEIDRGVEGVGALLETVATPGARVAIMLPNGSAFPLTWLACARTGRIAVPINAKAMPVDAAHALRDSGAEVVVTTSALAPVVRSAIETRGPDWPPLAVILEEDIAAAAKDPDARPVSSRSQRLVNIQYTSGTTGLPKGCMLSHTYWLEIARSLCTTFPRVGRDDVLYTAQPFSYIDPQWNAVTALMAGARLVVDARFSASRMWSSIREHQVTLFYCLGVMPAALLAQPASEHDRDHRVRSVIASAIPTDQHALLEKRWGVPWYEAYGMTESGADLIVSPADHDGTVGRACLGRPHRGKEVLVCDPEGRRVPPGQPGELLIRGVGLMDGYWGLPEATWEAFREGWLRSGDQVVMDEEGLVYYRSRLKDVVRRSGENISSREVEAVLEQHPGVAMAAVVPVPDPLREEEVGAYVVLTEGHELPWHELRDHCASRIAPFKVPRYWAIRERLPMTPSERVAKAALRRERAEFVDGHDSGSSRGGDRALRE